MTKEKHIYYLEKMLEEEIINCEDDETKLLFKQIIFDVVGDYITVLKQADISYWKAQSASTAFAGMLSNRIKIAMEENHKFDDHTLDRESVNSNLNICKRDSLLGSALVSVLKIFCNWTELRELAYEIMCQAREKNRLSNKQGLEEANACNEQFMSKNIEDEWIESFGCTIQNIKDLETLIGTQSDFDEVMGRIINVKYY